MRKTKIICTLGPATDDKEVLKQLMLNGMDVARINMSHQGHAVHKKRADMVKELREELHLPIALLLDTKGPEIRTGSYKTDFVELKKGQTFTLTTDDVIGDNTICSVSFKNLPNDLKSGDKILISDGLVEMEVKEIIGNNIICNILNDGILSAQKGINIPGVKLSLPFISKQDEDDIAFAVEQDFDFIATSFTRTGDDVMSLRRELQKNKCNKIRIICKIENNEGVDNIDDIIHASDGIMVARGDLGVEVPLEDIPIIQKQLISKVYKAGKQVITATQMLESMMHNPRPTRAESTDVANAIYDGTSAIMLSGETAAGDYPIEALKTMALIAERAEEAIDYVAQFKARNVIEKRDVTSAISHATVTTAHDLNAKAILTVSKSGETAKMISKYRPNCPIISGTTEPNVFRQMNMSWGVIPVMTEEQISTDELFDHIVNVSTENGLVKNGDLCVITAGVPLGVSGTTNLLKVHLVGDVLVSGMGISESIVCGKLCVCKNTEEAKKTFHPGEILVIPKTDNSLFPLIKESLGIITEEDGINSHAAIAAMALDKPILVGAKNASTLLKSGTTVTLDTHTGNVYSGTSKHHRELIKHNQKNQNKN